MGQLEYRRDRKDRRDREDRKDAEYSNLSFRSLLSFRSVQSSEANSCSRFRFGAMISQQMAKEKVLIVDDDQMIRWSLTEALRNWGYACVEAGTVTAALATFDTEQPAAVLVDVNLPDGSGLDGLREIKRRQPDAVVIMMTGSVRVADTIAALRGGAYDFVGKPINLEELQITIRNGIEAQSL